MMASATISLADMVRDAVAFDKEGRVEEAAALYEAALRMEPRNADALHLLGVIDHQRGDQERAVTRIRQALSIHGPRSNYLSNLGIALRALGRTVEAIDALRRAAELDPTSADI